MKCAKCGRETDLFNKNWLCSDCQPDHGKEAKTLSEQLLGGLEGEDGNGDNMISEGGPVYDAVNHPDHYNRAGIEVIDVIEAYSGDNFHKGNVIKYVCRSGHKNNEIEDLKKARWYLDRLIENMESRSA